MVPWTHMSQPQKTAPQIGSDVFAQLTCVHKWSTCHLLRLRMDSPDVDLIEYMVPWIRMNQTPKQHLDWLSRFAGLTTSTQTDGQTDRQNTLLRL